VREPRFKLLPFDNLRPADEPPWLVKRLIPRVGLVVVWGPPKSGKSFYIFDLMMHVALEWKYRNRTVHGGPVVYCAFEGGDGEAFRQRQLAEGAAGVPFYLVATRIDLIKEHPQLIRDIRTQLGMEKPVAVVLDTLNRSLNGSESNDADMAGYIKAADAIREAFDCVVIIVHHCGVEGTRPRGHTSLPGAVDAQLAVKRDDADNVIVTVELMKDGPQGDVICSRLETVELGIDADDEAITSCVIVPADDRVAAARTAKGSKKPSAATRIALKALQQAVLERGEPALLSEHIPADAMVVSPETWREYCYSVGITSSSEPRARQLAFKRAFEKLVADGEVSVWDDHVWIGP
jgi:hypothetical protein